MTTKGRKPGSKVESYSFNQVKLTADAPALAKLRKVQELAEVKLKRAEILGVVLKDAMATLSAVEITALIHEAEAKRKANAEQIRKLAKLEKAERDLKRAQQALAELRA